MLQEHFTVMGDVKARDWIAVMLLQGFLAKPHESAIRTTARDMHSSISRRDPEIRSIQSCAGRARP